MVFPFPLRMDRSDLRGVSGARPPAYDEISKGRYRVGFRPQADLADAIACVPMLQEERTIQRRLDVLPHRPHPDRMPLPERGRLYGRRGQLVPPTVVGIQPKVVLQGVGAHDIV